MPIRFKYGYCSKCLRDKCIELIELGTFATEVIERNHHLAVAMLTSTQEYQERNPKYYLLDLETREKIEQYIELILL